MPKLSSKEWQQQKRWILGSLLLCPPLGIPLLWLSSWPKAGKISGSVLSGLLLLFSLVGATADPEPTKVQTPSVKTAQTVAIESKTQVPAAPPSAYEDALLDATAASKALPTAETSADWGRIAAQWQSAIALLNDIPTNSNYSAQAQAKAEEYQRNYGYANEQIMAIAQWEAEADAIAAEELAAEQSANETVSDSFVAPVQTDSMGSYVSGSCKDLRDRGVGSNFVPGDANYSSSRDRDNDGVACES